jgi:signal transduction histidine kinase
VNVSQGRSQERPFSFSISRRAVAANGGEIRALNLPGKGCIFTIDLPAASALAV